MIRVGRIKGGARAMIANITLRLAGLPDQAEKLQAAHATQAGRVKGTKVAKVKRHEKADAEYAQASPWLEKAHAAYPRKGRTALAAEARRMVDRDLELGKGMNSMERTTLRESIKAHITEERARTFLEASRRAAKRG